MWKLGVRALLICVRRFVRQNELCFYFVQGSFLIPHFVVFGSEVQLAGGYVQSSCRKGTLLVYPRTAATLNRRELLFLFLLPLSWLSS